MLSGSKKRKKATKRSNQHAEFMQKETIVNMQQVRCT